MIDLVIGLWFFWFFCFFLPWFFFARHWEKDFEPGFIVEQKEKESAPRKRERKFDPDDYWDEGGVREYGGISSNPGARIRHPKNVDRAYSGGAERFDDGGW